MQSFSVLGVIAAAAVVTSGAAFAQTPAAPAPPTAGEAARAIAWRCEGPPCAAPDATRPPSLAQLRRECERVVGVIGPVTRYVSRGRELDADELARCNRYATASPIAAR